MKMRLALLVWVFLFAGPIFAQKAETPMPQLYDLGGRSVRVPAPERFTDTVLHYPRIAARLIASESPENEVLAVHVTDEIMPQIKAGGEPDLPFYTKVSVWKQLKGADVETHEFRSLAAEFEKQSPAALQSIAKTGETGAGERLTTHWGSEANLKIGETRLLGVFDKQPQSVSSMFLMSLEMFNRKLLVLGSMSLVHVNKRVLFLYVFRTPESAADQDLVAEMTRSWVARTVAANK
jgi:hypothetical protein